MLPKQQQAGDSQTANSDTSQAPVAAPTLSLPKGGGAIRGIGEKFGTNPVTGTGSMTVPIATSPGRSGFGPQLRRTEMFVTLSTYQAKHGEEDEIIALHED